jgi:cyclopropane fatty-acyl-phospholipid synthase-like methyltransferase
MTSQDDQDRASGRFDFYRSQYRRFSSDLAGELRREVYGEDIGQQGWRTAAEQAEIADHLCLGQDSRVLDIACGAGGPSLALVRQTRCHLTGLDVEADGIAQAQAEALSRGLTDYATFVHRDCNGRLPFEDGAFDAVLCIDAITHLGDRFGTIAEWARLLRQGGRLVFTDSAVVTGAITKSELDIRCTTGFFLLVPPGLDQEAIEAAGLTLVTSEDRTAATAKIAANWHAARLRHAAELEREEGAERFAKLQHYYATASELAASRRLSRFLYVGEKAG